MPSRNCFGLAPYVGLSQGFYTHMVPSIPQTHVIDRNGSFIWADILFSMAALLIRAFQHIADTEKGSLRYSTVRLHDYPLGCICRSSSILMLERRQTLPLSSSPACPLTKMLFPSRPLCWKEDCFSCRPWPVLILGLPG